jgi:hypothetical protein
VHEEQANMDVSKDSFSKPLPFLDRLAVGVRALEEWYAVDFERRVSEITGVLRTQITDELRAQFTTELNATAERTRKQYEERAYMQFEKWESERLSLKKEIEELQSRIPTNNVANEIVLTETAIGRSLEDCRYDVQREVVSADALGQLLQKRAQHLELNAYLKGLKFASERSGSDSRKSAGLNENVPVVNPSLSTY